MVLTSISTITTIHTTQRPVPKRPFLSLIRSLDPLSELAYPCVTHSVHNLYPHIFHWFTCVEGLPTVIHSRPWRMAYITTSGQIRVLTVYPCPSTYVLYLFPNISLHYTHDRVYPAQSIGPSARNAFHSHPQQAMEIGLHCCFRTKF
jgi:hypothetical protein